MICQTKVKFVCPSCGGTTLREERAVRVFSYITGIESSTDFEYRPIRDGDVDWENSTWITTECANCHRPLRGTDEDMIKWLKEQGMLVEPAGDGQDAPS